MKQLFSRHAIVLAALLQVLPVVRNLVTNPAAPSAFAIIMRWTIGSTAALGAYDAFSASSTPYFMPFQTNISLTVGTYYSNNIIVTNTGTDPGAYFELTNTVPLDSGQIGGNQTTTVCLPTGLTLKCYDKASSHFVYAAIYGTPTTAGATAKVTVTAGFSGAGEIRTNVFFTVAGGASPPTITNQPVSITNLVSSNATFSVTAGGTAPLKYQWYFNTNTSLLNATNSSLTLTNIQTTNAGLYSVTITNSAGSTNSAFARLTVLVPPGITNQPTGATNVAGGAATFTVLTGGTTPLFYQWYFNTNTSLPNATNTSLGLTNIRASQAGNYSVIVTNVAGAVTSSPALLGVTLPASPAIMSPSAASGQFQFTFNPVIGLTNSVVTNDNLSGGNWVTLTNVPPPATTDPVTVSDNISGTNRFYRVQVVP